MTDYRKTINPMTKHCIGARVRQVKNLIRDGVDRDEAIRQVQNAEWGL
jgi:hypothetical protein